MNDVLIEESKVFDACGLIEEIVKLSDVDIIRQKAIEAANLLNQALENSVLVRGKGVNNE